MILKGDPRVSKFSCPSSHNFINFRNKINVGRNRSIQENFEQIQKIVNEKKKEKNSNKRKIVKEKQSISENFKDEDHENLQF